MKQEEIEKAIENYIGKEPVKTELGGDYYFKCHWISCGTDLKPWYNYCPECGTKIKWEGINN